MNRLKAVHAEGSKIFIQLMHTGRISHKLNFPDGAVVLAPSAVKPAGQMWTDSEGMKDFETPKEMTPDELIMTKNEFTNAAVNAIKAGFDGVELHGANGYLLEQFLSPVSNQRKDSYGGSIENRCRFVLEVVDAVIDAIGKDNLGIRLSPYGVFNDMPQYPEIDETYSYLADELNKRNILYIHLVDHSSMGTPEVPGSMITGFRSKFKNTIIRSGGFTKERAEDVLNKENADLIAFGRPFINNPDLVERFTKNLPLSEELDMDTFYTPGEKGYTDYPVYSG
jgi:N-ethylmaleimide reductase